MCGRCMYRKRVPYSTEYEVAKHLLLGSDLVAAPNDIDMAKSRRWTFLAKNKDCNGAVHGISLVGALASFHAPFVSYLARFCLVDGGMPVGGPSEGIEGRPGNL